MLVNMLNELRMWLKIDGDYDDVTLDSLIKTSALLIKQQTGLTEADVTGDEEATELYKLVQKLIITDLYENREGSQKISPVLISLCSQLEAYKLKNEVDA